MAITHKDIVDMLVAAVPVITDELAAQNTDMFPHWGDYIGTEITQEMINKGYDRYQYNGRLYKVIQPCTPQAHYTPDIVPSLYVIIDVVHTGTIDDPIPAVAGMEYEYGKYYIEDNVTYICQRTGATEGDKIVLQYLPSQLIGQYFEVVE